MGDVGNDILYRGDQNDRLFGGVGHAQSESSN
ncbi:MAG: hypothetical protein KDA93_27980 [Planctomycetaceae bacterium]|nr:hypothetical protein [Planctomycetaceae bacterium]